MTGDGLTLLVVHDGGTAPIQGQAHDPQATVLGGYHWPVTRIKNPLDCVVILDIIFLIRLHFWTLFGGF